MLNTSQNKYKNLKFEDSDKMTEQGYKTVAYVVVKACGFLTMLWIHVKCALLAVVSVVIEKSVDVLLAGMSLTTSTAYS